MRASSSSTRRKFSWLRRCIYSLIPVVCLLLLLEGVLALVGVRPVTDLRDPYVGFAGRAPLFEEITSGSQAGTMVTADAKLVWFNPQSFPRVKPEKTKRVFCLGGSTTFGRPYSDPTSYVGWMRELLPIVDSTVDWEVINAGGVSYASYRVAALMEELVQYQPDLFVIYSAHNEFLERRTYAGMFNQPPLWLEFQAAAAQLRTFALLDRWLIGDAPQEQPADILPAEVDERLNHTIGPSDYTRDAVWRDQVIQHYRLNLQRMVDIAAAAGAKIVFVTPASNEKDCSPFKSEFAVSPGSQPYLQRAELLAQSQAATAAQDYPQAISVARQLIELDPGAAAAHYQLGKALFAAGEVESAHVAWRRAMEEDICPLRAIAPLVEQLRQVSDANAVPLVDFDRLLTQHCRKELGHACLGDEFFLDHVHPNIDTHRLLAVWIIQVLQSAGWVSGSSPSQPEHAEAMQRVIARVEGAIDQPRHGVALRNLAKVLHWSGKFEEAAPRASDALELLPGDPESRFVLADCLKNMGDSQGALNQYELLFEDTPYYARGILPYGELLVELGLYERAKPQLLLAVLREPENAYALYLLGATHLHLQEYAFAAESLSKSDQLYPGDHRTRELLRLALSKIDDQDSPARLPHQP